MMVQKPEITFVVLTYNESLNLPYLLENISSIAAQILVLDSYSTDDTVKIATDFGAKVFFRKFDNFSLQRNFALTSLPINTDWVFFIDADEMLTDELKIEILSELSNSKYDGYYINRRFYWKGRWIKRGYYPTSLLRLGRNGKIKCDNRPINEHLVCDTDLVKSLKNDFIDYNRKNLSDWLNKHNDYSTREALQLFDNKKIENTKLFGNQYQRKRWIRQYVWRILPPLIRPVLFFLYRYFIRLGFLDGKEAFMYHFLHAFLYRMLIDFKYLEIKWNTKKTKKNLLKKGARER